MDDQVALAQKERLSALFDLGCASRTQCSAVNAKYCTTRGFDPGATWNTLDGAPGIDFLAGDDKVLFGARNTSYWQTSATKPTDWRQLPTPPFANPSDVRDWGIKWDRDHRLLYSLNSTEGFWRMVVP